MGGRGGIPFSIRRERELVYHIQGKGKLRKRELQKEHEGGLSFATLQKAGGTAEFTPSVKASKRKKEKTAGGGRNLQGK